MKSLKLIVVLLFNLWFSLTIYSQGCRDFIKTKNFNISNPGTYLIYGQSRSESVEVRKTYNFEIVFYGQKEYLLGIATEERFEPVHFRIIENQSHKVLYDNQKYQYKATVNFFIEKTQNITIEVTIIASDEDASLSKNIMTCLGIKILNQSIN